MIRLVLHSDIHPQEFSFEKQEVLIGSSGADLTLPGESLQSAHVKISEDNGRFFIYNLANDPFVTLNGHSFGKKAIKSNDLIQIGNSTLRFEGHQWADTGEKLHHILEAAISAKAAEPSRTDSIHETSFEDDIEMLEKFEQGLSDEEEGEFRDLDLESLIQQVEELEEEEAAEEPPKAATPSVYAIPIPASPEIAEQAMKDKYKKSSLKDSYLSHLDDDNQTRKKAPKASQAPRLHLNWKAIGIFCAFLATLILIISVIVYFSMSDRNNEDESQAAEGVADIAMALTYAELNHHKPQQQNWSDPQFIKNSLASVIPAENSPAGSLDMHGQFKNNSYLIRIYTSSNLDHFVVIAQPAPSVLQWLIPKASIVVDSKSMELRKINDIKALNRLLLTPNVLDGNGATELSQLIRQGELIPLAGISAKGQQKGFIAPRALGMLRPGSENLIYNAPRYYRFGESFLNKVMMLQDNPAGSHEVEMLQQEMEALSQYPDIVLYSSSGMQWATHAQRGINTFLPGSKILVAYLKFNAKKQLTSSHLLMDGGEPSEIAMGTPTPHLHNHFDTATTTAAGSHSDARHPQDGLSCSVDPNHPLLLQLAALEQSEKALKIKYEREMADLLETGNRPEVIRFLQRLEGLLRKHEKFYDGQPDKQEKAASSLAFLEKLRGILSQYEEGHQNQETNIIQGLSHLYHEYSDMPLCEFMKYVQAAGLSDFVNEHLKFGNETASEEGQKEKVEDLMAKISSAATLNELADATAAMSGALDLEKFPDPKSLITYQEEAKSRVAKRLNDFLLSKNNPLPQDEFTVANRPLLTRILKDSWINDPDEAEFYQNEFNSRLKQD